MAACPLAFIAAKDFTSPVMNKQGNQTHPSSQEDQVPFALLKDLSDIFLNKFYILRYVIEILQERYQSSKLTL